MAQPALANPWPTRKMGGIEVVVEDTFPFDQNNFLSVLKPTKKSFARNPSVFIHQLLLSHCGLSMNGCVTILKQ
jgi:hypothetical protein